MASIEMSSPPLLLISCPPPIDFILLPKLKSGSGGNFENYLYAEADTYCRMENDGGRQIPSGCGGCCYKERASCEKSSHRCTNQRARVLFDTVTHHWVCHSFEKHQNLRLRMEVSL